MKTQEYYFEIPENASSEVIVWHKYPDPDKKFEITDWFMLTIKDYDTAEEAMLCYVDDNGAHWLVHGEDSIDESDVIAYAEMPKGYKEDK